MIRRLFSISWLLLWRKLFVDSTFVVDCLCNSKLKILSFKINIEGNDFSRGQLRSYMRTPVGYYVAQLLSSSGKCPSIVVGTGNKGSSNLLLSSQLYFLYFTLVFFLKMKTVIFIISASVETVFLMCRLLLTCTSMKCLLSAEPFTFQSQSLMLLHQLTYGRDRLMRMRCLSSSLLN